MRSDEIIKRDIVDEMYWDYRVDSSDVNVEVSNGKVTLSGTVPSYTARLASADDSYLIDGVRTVINLLTVKFPETATVPTDEEIRTSAERVLAWNPDVYSLDILVNVNAGVIKLEGTVDSYWKRWKAEDLISDLRGVIDVENHLAVVPTDDFIDKEIARDIEDALERNTYVNAENITVKVSDGEVLLTGTVPTYYAHNKAYTAAAFTPGVKEIDNEVLIT